MLSYIFTRNFFKKPLHPPLLRCKKPVRHGPVASDLQKERTRHPEHIHFRRNLHQTAWYNNRFPNARPTAIGR